jgi:hypothetical protein
MRNAATSSFRKGLLLLTTAVTAIGMVFGLPVKKASAAPNDYKMAPSAMTRAPVRQAIIQPAFVNPTAVGLLHLADMALSDNALAERIFREPDAVGKQFHLSNAELMVLRHMNREQFQVARADAATMVRSRMAMGGPMPAGATDARLITQRMIVGRAILAAVGRSYLDAANAHACCPWSKAIELGVSGDPALYNPAFVRPAAGFTP